MASAVLAIGAGFPFECFDDLSNLLAADPIHDVAPEAGWPVMPDAGCRMPDSIAAFARAAMESAQETLETAALTQAGVAGVTIGIAETMPRVVDWLSGQFDPPKNTPHARIYCDYYGSHTKMADALGDLCQISPLELDDVLAKAGLFGSFGPGQNRWDIFTPRAALASACCPTPTLIPNV